MRIRYININDWSSSVLIVLVVVVAVVVVMVLVVVIDALVCLSSSMELRHLCSIWKSVCVSGSDQHQCGCTRMTWSNSAWLDNWIERRIASRSWWWCFGRTKGCNHAKGGSQPASTKIRPVTQIKTQEVACASLTSERRQLCWLKTTKTTTGAACQFSFSS